MVRSFKDITSRRKSDLIKLYNQYYCENGRCKYYGVCSEKAIRKNHTEGYDSSFSARIGENYDLEIDGKPIRILFVGKEARSKKDYLHSPARFQDFLDEGKVNLHYRETYKMLCEMLNYNWQNGALSDRNKFLYKPDGVLTCFCLTNMYRCSFKKYPTQVKGIKNYPEQTTNCLELLKAEIKVLEPTIIILQKSNLHARDIAPNGVEPLTDTLFYSNDLNAHIIETTHPSNYGKWYNEAYPKFSKNVKILRAINKLPAENCSTTVALDQLENKKSLE